MHSKFTRIFTAVIAVLAIAAVVMPAAASAKKKKGANKTKVTIVANGGDFSGTISHKNPLACATEREVYVYHVLGSKPSPSSDDEVGMDNAENGEWNTGNNGANDGTYYAYAPATAGCKAGISKTVQVTGRPAEDF